MKINHVYSDIKYWEIVMIKLDEVIICMEMSNEDNSSYYNTRTNEIVNINHGEAINEEDKEALEIIDYGDIPYYYKALPDKYDIDEYRWIKKFICGLDDERIQDTLLDAIRGKGAFRRFKDALYECGIELKWYEFRDKVYRDIAVKWLDENNIEYEE